MATNSRFSFKKAPKLPKASKGGYVSLGRMENYMRQLEAVEKHNKAVLEMRKQRDNIYMRAQNKIAGINDFISKNK